MNLQTLFTKLNNSALKILINSVLSLMLSYTVFIATGLSNTPAANFAVAALMSLVFSGVCLVALKSKKSSIISGTVLGAGIIGVVLSLLLSDSVYNFFMGYGSWLSEYFSGYISTNAAYIGLTFFLVIFIITVIFYLLFFKFGLFLLTSVFIIATLFLVELYSSNIPDAPVYFNAAFALILMALGVNKEMQKKYAGHFTSSAKFTVLFLPFCLIVMIIGIALPKSDLPMQIHWIDNIYNKIYEATAVMRSDNDKLLETAFNLVGGELDGSANPNKIKIISVNTVKPEYLRFSVKDQYSGHSWADTQAQTYPSTDQRNEANQQQLEMKDGVRYLSNGALDPSNLFSDVTMTITFKQVKLNYLFTPENYFGLNTFGEKTNVSKSGVTLMNDKKGRDFMYSVSTYDLNYGGAEFESLLRNSQRGIYNYLNKDGNDSTLTELAARSDNIYKVYTQLPSGLPARVKNLAQQLTQEQQTDFDKVKVIETYLSRFGTYTLNPPQRPINADMVDYFLFNSKQGYCTSYATAMTVLVRSLGIPARYCEGFVMPKDKGGDGDYLVTNENAHAWCEVYFEGFGWVPFEPTKTFNEIFYQNAAQEVPQYSSSLVSSAPSLPESAISQNTQSQIDSDNGEQQDMVGVPSVPDNSSSKSTPPTPFLNNFLFRFLLLLLIAAVIAAAGIIMAKNGKKAGRMFDEARKCPDREAIRLLYRYYLGFFKAAGFEKLESETAYEYRNRLVLKDKMFAFVYPMTAAYVRARYSQYDPNRADIERIFMERDKLEEWFKSEKGNIKFVFYRYIMGMI